jgi:RNA polymerase sigma-70 factor (ECF subfamily)
LSPTPEQTADLGCVRRLLRGDESALGELYDRHAGALLSVAQHMLGDTAAAEDAVHNVLLEAWRRADAYDAARGTVRSWLLVRMRSRCLDRLRAARVRRDLTEHEAPVPQPAPRPDEGMAAGDVDRLQAALVTLPEAQRAVVDLVYLRGFTCAAAAEALDCPLGTIKSRIRLALAALRDALAAHREGSP